MNTEVVRRKNWRSEQIHCWLIVGMSASDSAYWLYQIRRQSAEPSHSVKSIVLTKLTNEVGNATSAVFLAGDERTLADVAHYVQSIRCQHSDVPIIIWAQKLAGACSMVLLEAGASVVVNRREDIPGTIARLLKVVA